MVENLLQGWHREREHQVLRFLCLLWLKNFF